MAVDTTDWELPILGEPVPVELANTRYRDGAGVVDFLANPFLADRWFRESPTASKLARPRRWSAPGWIRLVELRNAADVLLRARIDGGRADPWTVAHLNSIAALASCAPELRWDGEQDVRRVERLIAGDQTDALLGTVAHLTIALLAGADAMLLRVCGNDDCQMLFLKTHHRRRWCHNSCGHRHRQAKYYRSRNHA